MAYSNSLDGYFWDWEGIVPDDYTVIRTNTPPFYQDKLWFFSKDQSPDSQYIGISGISETLSASMIAGISASKSPGGESSGILIDVSIWNKFIEWSPKTSINQVVGGVFVPSGSPLTLNGKLINVGPLNDDRLATLSELTRSLEAFLGRGIDDDGYIGFGDVPDDGSPGLTSPLTVTGISVQGSSVTLNFSGKVTAESVLPNAFTVATVNASNEVTNRQISAVKLDPNDSTRVILTLTGTPPASSLNLRVSYSDPALDQTTGILQDLAGNDIASFTDLYADTFITSETASLASEYRDLNLTGNSDADGTGNTFANLITGNNASNILAGLGGTDTLTGAGGVDTLNGGAGADLIDGGAGADVIGGGGGSDVIDGGAGSDVIGGGAGADVIDGGTGADVITGGAGADVVTGGVGADVITGGGGADTFRCLLTDSVLSSFDQVTDFTIGIDQIDGPNTVLAADVVEAGKVSALTEEGIAAALTPTSFVGNGAATFTFASGKEIRTFLALNDKTDGFSDATDAIIEITGYTGDLADLDVT